MRTRRAVLASITSLLTLSVGAVAAWPRRVYDIPMIDLSKVADIHETIRSPETLALVRTPSSKPPFAPEAVAPDGAPLSSAELAELEDAEADVQGLALSADDLELARNLNEVAELEDAEGLIASLSNPLDDAINRLTLGPDAVVGGPIAEPAPTDPKSTLLARLAGRAKPEAPELPKIVELPIKPQRKGRSPLSLASLSSPEEASRASKPKTAAKTQTAAKSSSGSTRSTQASNETRTLTLLNQHFNERMTSTYMRNGKYVQSELKRLNYLMRDRRSGAVRKIDPKLFDALYEATSRMGARGRTIKVLSGYRSKASNDALRRSSSGVAKNSYHTLGRAIDFNVPGFKLSETHKNALKTNAGGVGYYPSSNFVHMDTGPIRAWPSRYAYIAKRYQRPT